MEVTLWFAFGLTLAAIFGWFAFGSSWLKHREEERLRAHGVPAQARIVDIENTGKMFNYMPEVIIHLDVTVPGRPAWRASFRRIMAPNEGAFFAPGRTVPIRYDESRPERAAFAPNPRPGTAP